MSGIALQGARCRACRTAVLQSFLSISGTPVPAAVHRPHLSFPSLPIRRRALPLVRTQAFSERNSAGSPNIETTQPEDTAEAAPEQSLGKSKHIPWYLEESQTQTRPHNEQVLPPLPKNPPPILSDLLHYVSMDAGLDDLALLDLREVDPPPALGANLIMVIGTARSVKHLNVAADRTARWLRATHKLRPVADGLLGRNELKIKLRRKARKAKLASSVGANISTKDHGLTTGWICVNVGGVENGKSETAEEPDYEFVGFKDVDEKARIVIQMVTEEKRAELDLEGLWNKYLLKNTTNQEDTTGTQADGQTDKKVDSHPDLQNNGAGTPSNQISSNTPSRRGSGYEQRRGIHTKSSLQSEPSTAPSGINPQPLDHPGHIHPPHPSTPTSSPIPTLFEQLLQLPPDQIQRELGNGPHDQDSSLFLRSLHHYSSGPYAETGLLDRLKVIRSIVEWGHPGYTKSDIYDAFKDLAVSGYEIPEDEALKTVETLLFSHTPSDKPAIGPSRSDSPNLELALQVLDHMSLCGMDILSQEVFIMFHKASAYPTHVRRHERSSDNSHQVENVMRVRPADYGRTQRTQKRLRILRAAAGVQFDTDHYLDLLRIHFHHGNFDEFWRRWDRLTLKQEPHTKEHYMLLFDLHAELGNESLASKCMFKWFPMMAREEPPVELDEELARSALGCLSVADPTIQRKVSEGPQRSTSVSMLRECVSLLNLEQNLDDQYEKRHDEERDLEWEDRDEEEEEEYRRM